MRKIIAVLLSLGLVFSMSSCIGSSPEVTAEIFLDAVKEQDEELLQGTYSGDNLDLIVKGDLGSDAMDQVIEDGMFSKVLKFEYEVSNEKIDGDKATVDVKIKTYNFGDAVVDAMEKYIKKAMPMALEGASEKKLEKLGIKIMKEEFSKVEFDYVKTATLSLTKEDGDWMVDEIEEDSDFENAITGGMIEARQKIEDKLEELY